MPASQRRPPWTPRPNKSIARRNDNTEDAKLRDQAQILRGKTRTRPTSCVLRSLERRERLLAQISPLYSLCRTYVAYTVVSASCLAAGSHASTCYNYVLGS